MGKMTKEDFDAEFAQLELEEKRERVAEMKAAREERESKRDNLRRRREQVAADIKKADEERVKRQKICRHKKGGRNNNFAHGNGANYSVITNTYPTGVVEMRCTRCGDTAYRPDKTYRRQLKKQFMDDPPTFDMEWAANKAKWEIWKEFSTDNEPSGGQIFLVESAA